MDLNFNSFEVNFNREGEAAIESSNLKTLSGFFLLSSKNFKSFSVSTLEISTSTAMAKIGALNLVTPRN